MLFCKKSSKLIRIFGEKLHIISIILVNMDMDTENMYVEKYIENMGNASYYATVSSLKPA